MKVEDGRKKRGREVRDKGGRWKEEERGRGREGRDKEGWEKT